MAIANKIERYDQQLHVAMSGAGDFAKHARILADGFNGVLCKKVWTTVRASWQARRMPRRPWATYSPMEMCSTVHVALAAERCERLGEAWASSEKKRGCEARLGFYGLLKRLEAISALSPVTIDEAKLNFEGPLVQRLFAVRDHRAQDFVEVNRVVAANAIAQSLVHLLKHPFDCKTHSSISQYLARIAYAWSMLPSVSIVSVFAQAVEGGSHSRSRGARVARGIPASFGMMRASHMHSQSRLL